MTAPTSETVKLNAPVLRFALRILGWSQAELARRIGVHESTVSRAMAGHLTTAKIAQAIVNAIPGGIEVTEVVEMVGLSPGLPAGAVDIAGRCTGCGEPVEESEVGARAGDAVACQACTDSAREEGAT